MSKIEEIKQRLNKGYTLSIYGTRELLYEQMEEDIESLLIFFGAIKNRIEELENELENEDSVYSEAGCRFRIDELKRLLK